MRTPRIAAVALVALLMLVGCKARENARLLVARRSASGDLTNTFAPKADALLSAGRIDRAFTYTAPDGQSLAAWVLMGKSAEGEQAREGTFLLLHGINNRKTSFPLLGAAERLAKKGWTVVLPDLRAHGESGGDYITYGAKEKHDIKALMDLLVSEGTIRPPFYVLGTNLGASVAIQYAAIDDRVEGVVADAPYANFTSIGRHWLMLLPTEDFNAAVVQAGEMADFQPEQASTVAAAAKVRCPVVVTHGLLDMSAPLGQTEAVYQALAGPRSLRIRGPGEFALLPILEDWVAGRLDLFAREGANGLKKNWFPSGDSGAPADEARSAQTRPEDESADESDAD
jgi:pimeloyl-ACP methyl ester carboxylesterase